ncbi:Proteophosphoglycan ppg4 [Rhodotorula toruloides ATCC 204091]|uniref:Proteophosphoglycan ppg4 n=1 Tax=Rhodotorula toruloides TaxID=5286 RepID=A0A0K3CJ67_RHOTO|nr:Proteophosphoglycan ppg4 [Rhodotorula toruloides ATCC 204091]KAK4332292.1 Proteophosphoglycan ppg4 [Rhodotorula toruloides]PRQ72569.1 Proteophosphoglycan ppg4 [Rhodotorula toruloides]
MSYTGWSGGASGRCADSGYRGIHAHLIGGNWADKTDVAPSAVLCLVSFLALAGVGWRYREVRVNYLFVFVAALVFLALAFAIHAGLANTSPSNRPVSATSTSDAFFYTAFLLFLIGHILFTRVFLNRASLVHWPNTLLYIALVLLIIATILFYASLSRAQTGASAIPPRQYSQMRIASASFELIVTILYALLLPLAKLVAPELPGLELGLLTLAAWFLFVPAFCESRLCCAADEALLTDSFAADLFCIAAITADSSPLVCSQTFFYLSFSLFPFLALAILIGLPLPRWGFTLPPRDLVLADALPASSTAAALAHEEAQLEAAADWAEEERMREIDEERLLREAREVVGENAERAGLVGHGDDAWSLRLH